MAATEAGRLLTEGHRLAQLRIAAETVQLMRSTWALLDPFDLDATTPRWLDVSTRLLVRQHARSAAMSAQYLRSFRAVELSISDFSPLLADPLNPARAATSLTVTGPVAIKQQMSRSVPLTQAVATAEAMSAGAAMRHALNGGRTTLLTNVERDRAALGHVRVTDSDPCFFCAMLASRGPVYKDGSFARSDPRFTGPGEAKVHDDCGCTIEPVYRPDAEWPGRAREFADLWAETARGLPAGEARREFRRAYEARRST